jgi:hypothetical protein
VPLTAVTGGAGRGAPEAQGEQARDDSAAPVAYAFDPSQPGARRLLELVRRMKRFDLPTPVENLAPLWLAEDDARSIAATRWFFRPALPAGSSTTAARARPSSVA